MKDACGDYSFEFTQFALRMQIGNVVQIYIGV